MTTPAMVPIHTYRPLYTSSHALVVGINAYDKVPPLACARQDAEAVAQCLISKFGFDTSSVRLLVDKEATRDAILSVVSRFASPHLITPDSRVILFFAGHGTTRVGNRGEVGFLVPQDGDPNDLASLIGWHDLTRNSELIPAKHILFLMDACYGGLALTRALAPGATRFAKDMMRRYARQVLTAGKADEVVADQGGPIPGHSVFTGHLLQALEGNASSREGLISANSVMAYVYDRVATDYHSRQTPHYGFLDGDGDLIFNHTLIPEDQADATKGTDVLIEVSPTFASPVEAAPSDEISTLKQYLADPIHKIRLHDLVQSKLRALLHELTPKLMPGDSPISADELTRRLHTYEDLMAPLRDTVVLLATWGEEWHMQTLQWVVRRVAERERTREGCQLWSGLEWYPLLLLEYAGGITAIAAGNYRALAALLTTPVSYEGYRRQTHPAITATVQGIIDVERTQGFQLLPTYEHRYVPRSDYLFAALQPPLEDLLFFGACYERHFDTFEVFLALVYADIERDDDWGPYGRFCWQHRHGAAAGPLLRVIEEAHSIGPEWPPLRQGLFRGSLDRFMEISGKYVERVNNLGWR